MAEAATLEHARPEMADRSFLWRRLHSLSGVLPIGAFLCFHIFENLSALKGAAAYNEMVQKVNAMLPRGYFYGVELGLIVVPILFHSLYGIYIASTGQANVSRYNYGSNWAYWAQRVSGYVAFLYLLVHIGVLRVIITLMGKHLAPYTQQAGHLDVVTYDDVAAHLGNSAFSVSETVLAGNHIFALYLVGSLLTIFHFTNGLNGFAFTWGLSVGRVAQKRVRMIAWVLFAALAAATLNILFAIRFGGQG
jgi:succinate dehydrogenase / fumarate reductase cytochrome b subunit